MLVKGRLSAKALKEVLAKVPDDYAVIISAETWEGIVTVDDVYAIYQNEKEKVIVLDNMEYKSGNCIWEHPKN